MNPPKGGGFKFRGSFKLYQRHCDYAQPDTDFDTMIVKMGVRFFSFLCIITKMKNGSNNRDLLRYKFR